VACTWFGLAGPAVEGPAAVEGSIHRVFYNHRFPPRRLASLVAWARLEREEARAMRALAASFAPDVVVLWNLTGVSPHVVAAALAAAPRSVHFVSDVDNAAWPPTRSAWSVYWQRSRWRRLALPLLHAAGLDPAPAPRATMPVIVVSEFLKRAVLAARTPERILLLPWAVPAEFHPGGDPVAAEPAPLRLLYAGQIAPWKGIDTLLDALAELARRRPGTLVLTVAGDGHDRDFVAAVRRRLAEPPLDRVARWEGRLARESLPELYRRHDVYFLPSEWEEPFSIALVEAMASGLAVIATATGGTPEIVRDGKNGLLVKARDAVALAAAAERLLDDPALRRALGRGARATAAGHDLEDAVGRAEAFLGAS
jgi:glycosyltransferase involved in cell wall biosynthesis